MEGEPLSDNLFLISVKLVNKDNQAFSQSYYMTGLEPTALSDVQRTFEAPEYETTVGASTLRSSTPRKSPHRSHRPRPCSPKGTRSSR